MENYDIYHLWLGIPPEEQPPSHYHLLGIRLFEENTEVIRNAADRQRSHVKRLGVNQYQQLGQDLLNEIEVAKICLLRPEKRQPYDEQLRQHLQQREAATLGASTYEEQLHEETLIVGSDRNCDIVIDLPIISGIHCSVTRRKDKVLLRDLKSTNGTFVNFTRVTRPTRVVPSDLIVLSRDRRLKLPLGFFPENLRAMGVVFIGRSEQCEISIHDSTVSAFHARVLWEGESLQVEDLGSTNGTTLIDEQGKCRRLDPLTPTDLAGVRQLAFGTHRMSLDALKARSVAATGTWSEDSSHVVLDGE